MTNVEKLNEWIHNSGLRHDYIRSKLCLKESAYSLKRHGKRRFTQDEMAVFVSLGMSPKAVVDIFLT